MRATHDAVRVIGLQLARSRREQRRTAAEIAERAGITRQTLRRIERGDGRVAVGTVFEVALILGVPLFGADRKELAQMVATGKRDLALLPARVVVPGEDIDDDF